MEDDVLGDPLLGIVRDPLLGIVHESDQEDDPDVMGLVHQVVRESDQEDDPDVMGLVHRVNEGFEVEAEVREALAKDLSDRVVHESDQEDDPDVVGLFHRVNEDVEVEPEVREALAEELSDQVEGNKAVPEGLRWMSVAFQQFIAQRRWQNHRPKVVEQVHKAFAGLARGFNEGKLRHGDLVSPSQGSRQDGPVVRTHANTFSVGGLFRCAFRQGWTSRRLAEARRSRCRRIAAGFGAGCDGSGACAVAVF